MRALLAAVLLLMLNLQPLAGGALCMRHHTSERGAACDAVMPDDMSGNPDDHSMSDDAATSPMGGDCATAMACATPAPVLAGTASLLDLKSSFVFAELRPPATHAANAPFTPLFRPPIA